MPLLQERAPGDRRRRSCSLEMGRGISSRYCGGEGFLRGRNAVRRYLGLCGPGVGDGS